MKKASCALVLALALPAALVAYDNSPYFYVVFPECNWAAATGGGTWVPELQITNHTSSTVSLDAYYCYGTTYRLVVLTTSLAAYGTIKYTNILATMQALDSGFTYFGTSGCLVLQTANTSQLISGVIRISNGNYGKTSPGLPWVAANTANTSRPMMIPNIMQSSLYRTFTGFTNLNMYAGNMTVRFSIYAYDGNTIGNSWDQTFARWQYKIFNPFTKAGLSGTYTNNWLSIVPLTSPSSIEISRGLVCFGSLTNNTTNDTYGLIAAQWQ